MIRFLALIIAFSSSLSGLTQEVPSKGQNGAIDEEAFRRLHELRGDDAPSPKGENVVIGKSRGYLSLPDKNEKIRSAVIVFHEWWGLNAHIKHWADRLAAEGHAAIAIDLYGGQVGKTAKEAQKLMRNVDEKVANRIVSDALRFARRDQRIRADRIGTIGWCFGGTWSLRSALSDPAIDACVLYYGQTPTDPEILTAIGGSVLAVFGKNDPSIPVLQIDAFRAGLKKADIDHEILIYPAGHAFANPSSRRYIPEAASKAWNQVKRFLRSKLRPEINPDPNNKKPGS
ncbi:MAG: dienelactone hydrolase family protein [Planctomycetota bacterium]